jgi:NAD+-dependent protein deacetylase sirtuin 5
MRDDMPSTDLASFVSHLQSSKRIVALLGAGLSASSGLPTFRGAGGYWRTHDATLLATPNAFRNDPGLVWQFYSYRRHMALNAKPNRAHLALAELAKRNPNFITLSQNVDGLSPRAGHPPDQLKLLHGNLFDVKCWDEHRCGYIRHNDFTDPIVPALAIPEDQAAAEASIGKAKKAPVDSSALEAHIAKKSAIIQGADEPEATQAAATAASTTQKPPRKPTSTEQPTISPPANRHPLVKGADISSVSVPIPSLPPHALPQCPKCTSNLLRPGVVWFGESLPKDVMASVEHYFNASDPIDLMLVIGTSSKVYPAAGYAELARHKGARVAVVNMDQSDARNLGERDWFFEGDAAVIVPEMLRSVIGEVGEFDGGGEGGAVL